jgi:hypothetical protein
MEYEDLTDDEKLVLKNRIETLTQKLPNSIFSKVGFESGSLANDVVDRIHYYFYQDIKDRLQMDDLDYNEIDSDIVTLIILEYLSDQFDVYKIIDKSNTVTDDHYAIVNKNYTLDNWIKFMNYSHNSTPDMSVFDYIKINKEDVF